MSSSAYTFASTVTVCLRWSNTTSASVQHQRQVGDADRIGVRLAERLDRAHQVVGEHPHRAAGERRQIGQRRRPEPAELGPDERIRIARIAKRPAQHLPRAEADERVAADPALIGGLEQERGSLFA